MRAWLLALALLFPSMAYADQITADRPGVGIDPDVVPQWTLQPEVGTDTKEIRIGVLKGLEADWQGGGGASSESIKLALVSNEKLKASVRLAYDSQLHAVVEVPANIAITPWFNLGLDAMASSSSKVFATEFNFQPTSRLTITPTYYYSRTATYYYSAKTRSAVFMAWAPPHHAAIFMAWVPPHHDNVQLDIGWNQNKLNVGISTALDFSNLFRHTP